MNAPRASLARVALLAALALCACAAVLPKSRPSELFVLTTLERTPAPAAQPVAAPTVLLASVTLPRYLDRRELVTRLASNELRIEDLQLWAEPLRDSVPRALARDLAELLGEGKVQPPPWTAVGAPDAIVVVELRRFEKTSQQTVELHAAWTIGEGPDGAPRLRHETRLALPVATPDTHAAVAALSEALARLSREIAAGLAPAPRASGF